MKRFIFLNTSQTFNELISKNFRNWFKLSFDTFNETFI